MSELSNTEFKEFSDSMNIFELIKKIMVIFDFSFIKDIIFKLLKIYQKKIYYHFH